MRGTLLAPAVLIAAAGAATAATTRDHQPPKFAGLKTAIQCVPGAQRPHERRPVALSWKRATDNVTPSRKILYEIYMSRTAGGEHFSKPNWSVRGKRKFTTPPVRLGRYFVVRARDRAGNEDHNRVQKRAQNPCV